ncbi:MAG TPA: adenosine deaminase [Candidatus Limnocylindria bacterium]|nr:adenosine deaminase [Candidatus Limnocylindria bacterium]
MTETSGGLNLHSHLEGSVRPSTAAELAADLGIPGPPGGWADALEMRQPGTLTTFLAHVAHAYPLFATPDAVSRLVTDAVEDAAADGTRYLELRFGPATHAGRGMTVDEVVAAACEGIRAGAAGRDIDAGLVVCALRHHDPATNASVGRAAARFAGQGVVGFDVAGDELLLPELEPLREPFDIARAAGLGLTAHAAEAGPASAVRDAVEILGVRRIGHGSRAAEDPTLLRWAADAGICFEVCPTSNVLTGAAASYEQHPARAFVDAGCDVVVGDDDPTTTGSRLANELRLLEAAVGLSSIEVTRLRETSIERVFCEGSVRAELRAEAGS